MGGTALRREIEQLDPVRDHQRIVYLLAAHEFPFDVTRSLELALFRTFAAPSISAVLHSTHEFQARAQRRYDDTDLLISEFFEHGYDGERGRDAVRRMNRLHGRYRISNEDFLYVLSSFVMEPIRWLRRFGWRPLTPKEELATFYFWRAVGERMNIREIPSTFEEMERYNVEYEQRHFRYAESNRRTGEATRDMFVSWLLPRPMRHLGYPAIHALLDDPVLDAMGWPRPPRWLRALVVALLGARAFVLRFLPPRRAPKLRTRMRHRTYPQGYLIDELGPAEPAHDSPFLRSGNGSADT